MSLDRSLVEQRVNELVNIEADIDQDISKLKEDTSIDLVALNDRNVQIRQKIAVLKEKLRVLKELAEEQEKESDKDFVVQLLARHHQEYKNFTASLRTANIICKTNIEQRFKRDREQLLEGGVAAVRSRHKSKQDALNTSIAVTSSLQRVRETLTNQLQLAESTTQVLVSSSNLLGDTINEHHDKLDTALRSGKSIITKMVHRDWTDQLLIGFAVIVFIVVVLYVIKSRVWG